MSKIVTKSGDKGMTSLLSGARVYKSDSLIEVCGAVDELSAFIGLLISTKQIEQTQRNYLIKVQENLLKIGTYYASGLQNDYEIDEEYVTEIECNIDMMEGRNYNINSFVKFNENIPSAYANICRTICRRLERNMIAHGHISTSVVYVNRLSDYLFLLSLSIYNHIVSYE